MLFFVDQGMNLKHASKKVAKECDKSWSAVQRLYYRHGKSKVKDHGHCTLTKEQSSILLLIIVVFSLLHEPLSVANVRDEVKNLFNVDVSSKWVEWFIEKHKDEVGLRKTKHLASKRTDDTIVDSVAELVAQVEVVREERPMRAELVVNYDETPL